MKDKKMRKLVAWLDEVTKVALASEMRVSPCGRSRELPPEAPTQSEAHAFRDGLAIGLQVAGCVLEDMMEGSGAPGMDPLEAYGRSVDVWIRRRRELEGEEDR